MGLFEIGCVVRVTGHGLDICGELQEICPDHFVVGGQWIDRGPGIVLSEALPYFREPRWEVLGADLIGRLAAHSIRSVGDIEKLKLADLFGSAQNDSLRELLIRADCQLLIRADWRVGVGVGK